MASGTEPGVSERNVHRPVTIISGGALRTPILLRGDIRGREAVRACRAGDRVVFVRGTIIADGAVDASSILLRRTAQFLALGLVFTRGAFVLTARTEKPLK